jgi:hypothetical protein
MKKKNYTDVKYILHKIRIVQSALYQVSFKKSNCVTFLKTTWYNILLIGVCSLYLQACKNLYLPSSKSFVQVQQKALYDVSNTNPNDIEGFSSIYIFKDDFDKSVWVSPETQCVNMNAETKNVYADNGALHVKWDKPKGGCKWIGIGFGWNNWVAKNMIDIADITAVQMQIKAVKGSFNNLPVAFAFEDYGGIQAYYGYEKTLSPGTFNDSTWTTVTIPLSKFPFKEKDFNIETVKQFMIQLEGDGDIYLDNIKFIKL